MATFRRVTRERRSSVPSPSILDHLRLLCVCFPTERNIPSTTTLPRKDCAPSVRIRCGKSFSPVLAACRSTSVNRSDRQSPTRDGGLQSLPGTAWFPLVLRAASRPSTPRFQPRCTSRGTRTNIRRLGPGARCVSPDDRNVRARGGDHGAEAEWDSDTGDR